MAAVSMRAATASPAATAQSPRRARRAARPALAATRRVAARAEAASTALPPPAVFNACVNTAKAKAGYPLLKTLTLGFTAGALIGIGALLMSHVGGGSPQLAASNPGLCNFLKGAVGLPTGLALVVLTGAELFTGNVMVMISGLLKVRANSRPAVVGCARALGRHPASVLRARHVSSDCIALIALLRTPPPPLRAPLR
jgi:hypothetical protein